MITLPGVALGFAVYAVIDWVISRRSTVSAPSVDEDGNWSFPMDTFAQMLDIPPERRARFIAELPQIFQRMWEMLDKYPMHVESTMWVDDGKGEIRPNIINAPMNCGDAFDARPLRDDDA